MKKLLSKPILLVSGSLLLLLLVMIFYVTNILKTDLIKSEYRNQEKIAKTIEQSLNLFFRTLVFITESTVSSKEFEYEKNVERDAIRYNDVTKSDLLKGFNILENKSNLSSLWQVYKGLPDFVEGTPVASGRREIVRNILANNPELHYAFEMDINGDLVFLEPYATQVGITSFNFGFRDYLKLSRIHKKTVISEGYLSHDKAKTQILTVASPIFDKNGEIKRVFAVSLSSKAIKEKIFLALKETIEDLDEGFLFLVDKHGHSIASSSEGIIYSPIVNKVSDDNDFGNLRHLDLFKSIKWDDDVFEKGNLWERSTKSWDINKLSHFIKGEFILGDSNQLGTLYPISILNNEKLWGVIVSSSKNKLDAKISGILKSALILWILLSFIVLYVTFGLLGRNKKLEEKLLQDQVSMESVNAQVAHDIRSPASVMKRILEKDALSLDDQKILVSLVRRIGDISNQILGLKNRPVTKEESLTVSETARMIIDEKKLQFSMFNNIKLHLKENAPLETRTDFSSTDLARILSNLINNSFEALIDYEGVIELEIKSDLGKVVFIVKDDGVGIPAERLKNINSGLSSKKSGKGLGLSSSRKKIIEAGGSFHIWSKQGSGAVVEFSLPVIQNKKNVFKTILVDDDKFIRLSWEDSFRKSGLDLHTFSHPKNLLQSLDRFSKDDFFILDTCGQGEDFYELVNKLKDREISNVFIYSGYDKNFLEKMNIPFNNIIPKDFDLRTIPL